MGCVASKADINDRHPNIFQVVNVDEVGHRFSPAKLEVTESDLVLHQRGKTPIRWPLRYLRRYGFDAELFSFESGRRCPTGPGIYAFKCRRAEALFNMLQLQIQNITEDSASHDPTNSLPPLPPLLPDDSMSTPPVGNDTEGYLEPFQMRHSLYRLQNSIPHASANNMHGGSGGTVTIGTIGTTVDASTGAGASTTGYGAIYRSVGSIQSPVSPQTPLGTAPSLPYEAAYDTEVMDDMPNTPVHTDSTDLLPSATYANHVDKPPCQPWYEAQVSVTHRPRLVPPPACSHNQVYVNVLPENRRHLYVNMDSDISIVPTVPPRQPTAPGSGSSQSATTTTTDTDQPTHINYIVVDTLPSSDSSIVQPTSPSLSGSPQGTCKGYAKIDFDKTRALNAAKEAAGTLEDGSRKTRHNSTFSGVLPLSLGHHNSSFSD